MHCPIGSTGAVNGGTIRGAWLSAASAVATVGEFDDETRKKMSVIVSVIDLH